MPALPKGIDHIVRPFDGGIHIRAGHNKVFSGYDLGVGKVVVSGTSHVRNLKLPVYGTVTGRGVGSFRGRFGKNADRAGSGRTHADGKESFAAAVSNPILQSKFLPDPTHVHPEIGERRNVFDGTAIRSVVFTDDSGPRFLSRTLYDISRSTLGVSVLRSIKVTFRSAPTAGGLGDGVTATGREP